MVIVGLAIIPLFAMIGLAIDAGRGYMLKSKLSYAIDAAGLAGGRAFDDRPARDRTSTMFFDANFPPGYMGAVLAPGHPMVTFDDEESTITIEATATIPTRFMSVAGDPRDVGLGAHRDQARAAGHGAGPGDGQYRLDARQRRQDRRDEGGREPS